MAIDDVTDTIVEEEAKAGKSRGGLSEAYRLLGEMGAAYYSMRNIGEKEMAVRAYSKFLSDDEIIFALTIAEEANLPKLMTEYARSLARKENIKLEGRNGNSVRTYMEFLKRGSYDHALSVSLEAGLPELLSQYARHMSAIQSGERHMGN